MQFQAFGNQRLPSHPAPHHPVRRLTRLLFLILCTSLLNAHAQTELTLMSYNIRLDLASDGPNRWDARKEQLSAQVATLAPTVLGIQEGLAHQVEYLANALPDYAYTGVGRDDGMHAGEFSALFYRKDRAELLASSTFWLSETPDRPSLGWDANYRRICTYAHFRDLETKAMYWVFNTHFDHESAPARLNGARLILERIDSAVGRDEAYFIMGDLNAGPESPPIRMFSEALRDTRIHSRSTPFGPAATFNAFDSTTHPTQRLDYIFASPGNTTVTAYATHSDLIEGRYPSDHFPVLATVQLQNRGSSRLKVTPDHRHLVSAYVPHGQNFRLKLPDSAPTEAHWFNPSDRHSIPFAPSEDQPFNPPRDEATANDWLLILTTQ